MQKIKTKDAILATKQVVESLSQKGLEVLGHGTVDVDPFDPIHGMPKETKTAVVIYLG